MNPAQYDPISTLERQYGDRPLGRRLMVVVSLNAECLVPGGVQTVLRHSHPSGNNICEGALTSRSSSNLSSNNNTINTSPSPIKAVTAATPSGQSSFAEMLAAEAAAAVDGTTADFGSLHLGATPTAETEEKKGWGSKLAKLAKNTQERIERKVTSMAIQAQMVNAGDAARDKLSVGAYLQNPLTGDFDACCGMTDSQEIPAPQDALDRKGEDLFAMTFRVPIYLPPQLHIHSSSTSNGTVIQLKLWIRSSLAILPKTFFNVGNAVLRIAALVNTLPQFNPNHDGPIVPAVMTLPLQSNVVTGAKVTLTILPDLKFPRLCSLGWSLTDPRTDTAYVSLAPLFNPPLDATWAFKLEANRNNYPGLLLATERTTESTLILPIAYAYHRLLAQAASISCIHASKLTTLMQCLDQAQATKDPIVTMQHGFAQVQLDIGYLTLNYGNLKTVTGTTNTCTLSLFFQRPDSIFEKFLSTGLVPTYYQDSNIQPSLHTALSIPFYPRIITNQDKRLIPSERLGPNTNRDIFLGSIRIDIRDDGIIDATRNSMNNNTFEAMIHIEPFLDYPTDSFVQIPVINIKSGQAAGFIVCKLVVHMLPTNTLSSSVDQPTSLESQGLLSFVGMESLVDECCLPELDAQGKTFSSEEDEKRGRQLATMGEWLNFDFMQKLLSEREKDLKDIQLRAQAYHSALSRDTSLSTSFNSDNFPPPSKRKEPLAFRPSSSRSEKILSGIGFNVHAQTVSLSFIPFDPSNTYPPTFNSLSSCQSITCGAPADHYRGFGPKGVEGRNTSGGLRRLESARIAVAEQIKHVHNALIQVVAQYFQAQPYLPGVRRVVKGNERSVQLRKEGRALLEYYHTLSWEIAVRRGNVFSQALGIAITSYLTLISDVARMQQSQWVENWKKYGFLLSFEGLLSTAGKELGMIEDASTAISMLRMVSLVLVSDDGNHSSTSSSVPVLESPYVRWVNVISLGTGPSRQFRVEIGVDPQYYIRLVPPSLRDGSPIQIYPIFFQMGVDVRQTLANAGMRVQASTFVTGTDNSESESLEVDEDEVGIADNDILIALNMEAFQKLNAYAHCVNPTSSSNVSPCSWEDAQSQAQLRQLIHPSLSNLYDLIRNSSAKMEHKVLDKAWAAVLQLGGGGATFCKSGKDRTAMQVTFKESQFINKFLSPTVADDDQVLDVASILRLYGTRLPVCEKNVGQALYAFNSLQVKFMPPELKPPSQTLAGFLKRGKVFSREGGVES